MNRQIIKIGQRRELWKIHTVFKSEKEAKKGKYQSGRRLRRALFHRRTKKQFQGWRSQQTQMLRSIGKRLKSMPGRS